MGLMDKLGQGLKTVAGVGGHPSMQESSSSNEAPGSAELLLDA
jgi:hypothetical protein